MVLLNEIGGVGEEEVGVGLQMDKPTVGEELTVTIQEPSGRETLAWVLHLRITEGKPYLADFVLREEAVDDLDIGSQEGNVLQAFVQRLCGP